jgi:hypothetical protein
LLLLLRRPSAEEEPRLRWVCASKWPAILFRGRGSIRKANNHTYCHMRLYDDDDNEE